MNKFEKAFIDGFIKEGSKGLPLDPKQLSILNETLETIKSIAKPSKILDPRLLDPNTIHPINQESQKILNNIHVKNIINEEAQNFKHDIKLPHEELPINPNDFDGINRINYTRSHWPFRVRTIPRGIGIGAGIGAAGIGAGVVINKILSNNPASSISQIKNPTQVTPTPTQSQNINWPALLGLGSVGLAGGAGLAYLWDKNRKKKVNDLEMDQVGRDPNLE
jgi:hypothetical protein